MALYCEKPRLAAERGEQRRPIQEQVAQRAAAERDRRGYRNDAHGVHFFPGSPSIQSNHLGPRKKRNG
jgi:hypothetical protein